MALRLDNCGIIIYDVPDSLKNFGNYLREQLRANGAVPVNLSVYLVNWPDVPRLEGIIKEAKKKYQQDIFEAMQNLEGLARPLRVNILKFDNVSAEKAREMAYEGLAWWIAEIHASLNKALRKMKKKGNEELSRREQVKFVKRLQQVYQMGVAFRLMEDVEVAYEAMRDAIVAQIGAKVATKYLTPELQADSKPKQEKLVEA